MNAEYVFKKEKDYCNITKYHEQGYKGKGITILNHENKTGHANMTNSIIKEIAPEATLINAEVSAVTMNGELKSFVFLINGERLTPQEMYDKYHPDIMSVSFIGHNCLKEEALKPMVDNGLLICCATGNKGSEGVLGMYKHISFNIGSVSFINGKVDLNSYSGRGENGEVSFVAFNGDGQGTSAATPFFAAELALFIQRFGKYKKDELMQMLPKYCKDIGDDGLDANFGHGVLILPESL